MLLNQYRAIYKNPNGTVETVYCVACSMNVALELLFPNKQVDPTAIECITENVLTQKGIEETTVDLVVTCVDTEGVSIGEEEGVHCCPSELTGLKRGESFYLVASANKDSYQFEKWVNKNTNEEYINNPLKLFIPTDERISKLDLVAVFSRL